MSSLLQSTLNTRALPTGDLRYIRSDFPGNLSDDEVQWLVDNSITTIVDLREEKEYKAKSCRLETENGFTFWSPGCLPGPQQNCQESGPS